MGEQKPAEIVFSEPVKVVPKGEKYWLTVSHGNAWGVRDRVANSQPVVELDLQRDYVHLTQEAAKNHAKILNDFGRSNL